MKFYTSAYRHMNYILHRGYDNGKRVIEKQWFKPQLFVQREESAQLANSWSTLTGSKVSPVNFDSMKEASDYIKKYDQVPNINIQGNSNYVAQFLTQNYPGKVEYDPDVINICVIDIEVQSDNGFPYAELAEEEVISITVKNNKDDRYHVWGLYDYDASKNDRKIEYYWCESEVELLQKFLEWWSDPFNTPDIITGWNSKLFDMVYMVNRITKILGEKQMKRLSPWGIVNYKPIRDQFGGKEKQSYEVVGVAQLDYIDLFKKFGYKYGNQESYKLDHIAHVVLGDRKLSYEDQTNLFKLLQGSKHVNINKDKSLESMEDFEKWVYLENKIDEELKNR